MSNFYSVATAESVVPCTKQEFDRLKAMLEADEDCYHGFEVEWEEGEQGFYLYAEENECISDMSDEAFEFIASLIAKAGMEYLEVGVGMYASRQIIGSSGGYAFRIYPNATLGYRKQEWGTAPVTSKEIENAEGREEELGDLMYDLYSQLACDINNKGVEAQLQTLKDNGVDISEFVAESA